MLVTTRLSVGPSISARTLVVGAILWALAMAASAWFGLWWREWETNELVVDVMLLFSVCAFVAFLATVPLAGWLARRWSAERRFALVFVALATVTIGLTALIYAVQYRLYYSEWHDHPFTMRWVLEVGFTSLAAMYQFAVMGMPLYFPLGFMALIAASLWFARRNN